MFAVTGADRGAADGTPGRPQGRRPHAVQPPATSRRVRVGIDFHTYHGIYQGSRSHLLGLYREAIAQAPDVDFFFFLARPEALSGAYPEFSRANVRLIDMPQRPGPWRLLWQLPAAQRKHRLDLLHVQFRLPLLPAGPCLCTLHDVLFETHPQYFHPLFVHMARWSARHAVRHAALTLTVSDYSRRQISRLYHVDFAKILLTPNAVDAQRFHPGRDGEELLRGWNLVSGNYLCMLGRLEPRKNHLNLVRAYAALGEQAPPLVIVGQRDFAYAKVFELIQLLHLNERVRIIENVGDDALPALLRHAKLMIYPSLAEGFGMPVLEALASGVPVITSNTTSLPEVAGGAAWLVAPGDVAQITAAVRDALAEETALRRHRIEQGLLQAARFNWQDAAGRLLAGIRAISR